MRLTFLENHVLVGKPDTRHEAGKSYEVPDKLARAMIRAGVAKPEATPPPSQPAASQ